MEQLLYWLIYLLAFDISKSNRQCIAQVFGTADSIASGMNLSYRRGTFAEFFIGPGISKNSIHRMNDIFVEILKKLPNSMDRVDCW